VALEGQPWLLFNLLIPVKRFLTTVPWPAVMWADASPSGGSRLCRTDSASRGV